MSDEKFQKWLDGLYRELLAPAKTKFVAEVRKRLNRGEVEKVPVGWLDEVERYLDGVNATVFVKEQVRTRHYDYGSVDFALIAEGSRVFVSAFRSNRQLTPRSSPFLPLTESHAKPCTAT